MKKLLVIAANLESFKYFVACYAPEYGSLINFIRVTKIADLPYANLSVREADGFLIFGEWPDNIDSLLRVMHNEGLPEYETVNDFITLNQ